METSVIIPSRSEEYLNKTIKDIKDKARSPIEIIVVLDGYDPTRLDGVTYIHNEKPLGMRTAINQAAAIAKGKYLLKTDAHCMFDEGFDTKLIAEHQPNWVQTPRRKRLEPIEWQLVETIEPDVDYMFINRKDLKGYKDQTKNRNPELKKVLIDDTGTFQGSCYFIERAYFHHLGLLDDKNFGGMGHESNEIVMKVLADGGRVIVNKKTWYAHYHKRREDINFRAKKDKSREYIFTLAKELNYGLH